MMQTSRVEKRRGENAMHLEAQIADTELEAWAARTVRPLSGPQLDPLQLLRWRVEIVGGLTACPHAPSLEDLLPDDTLSPTAREALQRVQRRMNAIVGSAFPAGLQGRIRGVIRQRSVDGGLPARNGQRSATELCVVPRVWVEFQLGSQVLHFTGPFGS